MRTIQSNIIGGLICMTLICCENRPSISNDRPRPQAREWRKPAESITYRLEPASWFRKNSDRFPAQQQALLFALNRVDKSHIRNLDSILVPNDLSGDIAYYMPFPFRIAALDDISKIIFFSYPAQAFAAYEYGRLSYTGPTNMGRKNDQTPGGLYYTNWKAEETTSTFNDEWELKWNVNIENQQGIGWHQYEMPGYPASHSCLRLLESDARDLYKWADEWKLKGTDKILSKGVPVIVFGSYPFGGKKPWLSLAENPDAIAISEKELARIAAPHIGEILEEQQKRENNTAIATR